MSVSFFILALISSFIFAFAIEKQVDNDIREELGRLKMEFTKLETEVKGLRHLKQRLSKVNSLESEVNELRWLLKQHKTERSKWL